MRDISLPAPLTSGNLCPDCGGTGADAAKTRAAYKTGRLDSGYISCWACNGNGLDPSAYFKPYSAPALTSKAQAAIN